MQRFQSNVQDFFGNAVSGVTVTVKDAGTSDNATLFSDDGVTSKTNGFTNDADGEFFFYAQNGRYDIVLSGPVTETRSDIILFDPDNAGVVKVALRITADPNPAVPGTLYFVDVTSAAVTITLPAAPLIGNAAIAVVHSGGVIATNNITIGRNGKNIMGLAQDMTVNTDNAAFQLRWSGDATEGWNLVTSNV
jgi:hypothetical protein